MAPRRFTVFEVSWQVCHKVGGIHAVLSSKAKTAVDRLGDDYVTIGPWLLSDPERPLHFEEEPGYEEFCESCRELGVPVRVGRWQVPGRPRCILVEFSQLYDRREDVLAELWEDFQVDSITGDWNYVEPVLFGHAAGMVIERWWEEYLAPFHKRAVVHGHGWMTGPALLYAKKHLPAMATVFTTHSTVLGRALAPLGHTPTTELGDQSPEQLAEAHGVAAKHSMEGAAVRAADVFTTVSELTAAGATLLHRRRPEPMLPNGMDLSGIDELTGSVERTEMRQRLVDVASRFLGETVDDAALLCVAGRYEFQNKGLDLLLDAMSRVNQGSGRRALLFAFVPAGNSGLRAEVRQRLAAAAVAGDSVAGESVAGENGGSLGVATHNLFDEEQDAIGQHCARVGLSNDSGSRVKVIQVPIYLRPGDGFLDAEYEAVLQAMDLTVFPAHYQPWGYTPQESLAVGVPTVTTDLAGFGRWARAQELGPEDGVVVLARENVPYADAVTALAEHVEGFLASGPADEALRNACRRTAARTEWTDLFANYEAAYAAAIEQVQERSVPGVPQPRRPRQSLPSPGASGRTPRLQAFEVAATLPESLRGLERLANNFWWSWNGGEVLFAELGWKNERESPLAFLQRVDVQTLVAKAEDPSYCRRLRETVRAFDDYMAAASRPVPNGEDGAGLSREHPVAYFCAEFGVHSSLPNYSGGLGVLAGDHLKSASDLNIPLVAIGLFYRMGYMGQELAEDGGQVVVERENDPRQLPLEAVRGEGGEPLEVSIKLPGRELHLQAWKTMVGRVPLYLLDADTPANRPEDREITRQLYGGDSETRIQQEIALGRGGVRLLRELNVVPAVCHMNEGHAAFLSLERVARLVREEGLTFEAAREHVRGTTLFTTHTPVPAGHDTFGEELVRRYFSDARDWVGVPWERFYALGRAEDDDRPEFNMTYLAMSFAGYVNGVSHLHGIASRRLLRPFWPGLLEDEVPVDAITNGVHLATWTHRAMARMVRREPGPVCGADFAGLSPNAGRPELWSARTTAREEMLAHVRRHVRRNPSPPPPGVVEGLVSDALYIGFARRFAPYKRAHLLFRDPERLAAILDNEDRPVRLLIAGKAHPRDGHGQDILRSIVQTSRRPELLGKVLFLHDYDIRLARALVQGVDIWLNTPTRMLEASGTSGMKSAANGGLNVSIADGWWPEAADGENGWTIGGGRVYQNQEEQDQADARDLYRLLEREVVPAFFERDGRGLPQRWLERVVRCLRTVPPQFDTDRMVSDYLERAYRPLGRQFVALQDGGGKRAQQLAREAQRLRKAFEEVRITEASTTDLTDFRVGQQLDVRVTLELASLTAEDVVVELVIGKGATVDQLRDVRLVALPCLEQGDGKHVFGSGHRIADAGTYSHGIRVRPREQRGGRLRGLVLWA